MHVVTAAFTSSKILLRTCGKVTARGSPVEGGALNKVVKNIDKLGKKGLSDP